MIPPNERGMPEQVCAFVSNVVVVKALKINPNVLYLIPLSISLSTNRCIILLAGTIQSGTTKLPRIKLLFVHKVPKWYLCDFSSECFPNVNAGGTAGGSIDVLERVGRGRDQQIQEVQAVRILQVFSIFGPFPISKVS